jgi:hypothetical protein
VTTIGSNLASEATLALSCSPADCAVTYGFVAASNQAPGGIVSPIDGVVVRWRLKAGATVGPVNLRVLGPGPGNIRTGAGTGPTETPTPNAISTFDAQLPIRPGDSVGFNCCGTIAGGQYFDDDSLENTASRLVFGPLADGTSGLGSEDDDREVLMNADVEPDCDNDGLGDETQDQKLVGPCSTLTCKGKPLTDVGTEGPNEIVGTENRDVINGLGGKDKISGLAGKDLICGGTGKDTLRGGKGKDKLLGQKGADTLKGGGGNDTCKGGKGRDEEKSC